VKPDLVKKPFDKDEWLLNRHRKRSENLLQRSGGQSVHVQQQASANQKAEPVSQSQPPPSKEEEKQFKGFGSRTIDSFGELLRTMTKTDHQRRPPSTAAAAAGAAAAKKSSCSGAGNGVSGGGVVGRSSSSAADCSRPSRGGVATKRGVSWQLAMESSLGGGGEGGSNSSTVQMRNSNSSSCMSLMKHRRKSDVICAARSNHGAAGSASASSHIIHESWWWEDPDPATEFCASDRDLMILERWVETMRDYTPNEPLQDFKTCNNMDASAAAGAHASSSASVLGKPSDLHGCTYDFADYRGERDPASGRASGEGCTVTYANGDVYSGSMVDGKRHGKGTVKLGQQSRSQLGGISSSSCGGSDVFSVEGSFRDNQLDGSGSISYDNGDVLFCRFCQGYVQGPAKLFSKHNELKSVCWYNKGLPCGLVWHFLVGGGFLIGRADMMGCLTGDDIAFLYPDLKTALLGTFIKGQMKVAQTAFVKSVTHRKHADGLMHLTFTEPRGPFFSEDKGTREVICQEPLLPDPYEQRSVLIKMSKIKGSGEGMYARRDFKAGTHLSFYNGIRMSTDELDDDSKEDWEGNAYKIMDLLGPDEATGKEGVIDIPPEYVSVKRYRASLAHKANHSFTPNAKFSLFEHPRFGKVPAVMLTEDVGAGNEVMVSYDYALDDAPPWYQQLFTQRLMESYRKTKSTEFDAGGNGNHGNASAAAGPAPLIES